jgi:hypothetical protein
MYFLAYVSTASPKLDEDALIDILIDSRRRNSQKSITGMLLHVEGKIIQIFEGEEHDVIQLFSKIEQDRRHYSIIKIAEGPIEDRNFNGWSMGFKSTSYEELGKFTGFPNITNETFMSSEIEDEGHEGVKILKAFYKNYMKSQ